jgi:Zn-dependent protease with chaperone function
VAVALLLGFYAVALVVATALIGVAAAVLIAGALGKLWVALACVVGAVLIVRALTPPQPPFMPPGPRLDPARNPELYALIREVAEATHQEPPAEVYLAHDFHAEVVEVGGVLLLGGCRVLILGLPLLDSLTSDELRSVLAHEFGHHRGRDARLGPLFYRIYGGIERTVAALEARGSPWARLLAAYGRFFLGRAAALRREEEFAADAVAAELAGADVAAATLRAVAEGRAAFGAYLERDFVPAVDGGVLPPFRDGYARFRDAPVVAEASDRQVARELAATTGPHDIHPSLGERLAALGTDPAVSRGRRAIELVRDPDKLEDELLRYVLAERELSVRRSSWDEVPERVLMPAWRMTAGDNRAVLAGVTAGSIPEALERQSAIGGTLFPDPSEAPAEEVRRDAAAAILGSGLALALHDTGWTLTAPPGEDVRLARGSKWLEPFDLTAKLARGEVFVDEWRDRMEAAGVAALSLSGRTAGEPRPAALAR